MESGSRLWPASRQFEEATIGRYYCCWGLLPDEEQPHEQCVHDQAEENIKQRGHVQRPQLEGNGRRAYGFGGRERHLVQIQLDRVQFPGMFV